MCVCAGCVGERERGGGVGEREREGGGGECYPPTQACFISGDDLASINLLAKQF